MVIVLLKCQIIIIIIIIIPYTHVQSQKEPLSRDAPLVQFIKVWIMEKHAFGD